MGDAGRLLLPELAADYTELKTRIYADLFSKLLVFLVRVDVTIPRFYHQIRLRNSHLYLSSFPSLAARKALC
jgi:hypothetical protein